MRQWNSGEWGGVRQAQLIHEIIFSLSNRQDDDRVSFNGWIQDFKGCFDGRGVLVVVCNYVQNGKG